MKNKATSLISERETKPKHRQAFMKCAEAFAACSNATRLQVGSVIVKDNNIISAGYNGMPAHLCAPCELPDGTTDPRVRHAEKNALMNLTRSNQSALQADLYVTHSCCLMCSIDLVDAGIKSVYYRNAYRDAEGVKYLLANGVYVARL